MESREQSNEQRKILFYGQFEQRSAQQQLSRKVMYQ